MSDLANAIKQICDEKGLSYEAVVTTIESALAAAYRKDFGEKNQNIRVEFNPETSKSKVFDVKTVVEDLPLVEEGEENKEEDTAGDSGERVAPGNVWDLKLYGEEVYENIKDNTKIIEARAGKKKGAEKDWRDFKEGDVINFSLVTEKEEEVIKTGELSKQIAKIHHFDSIDEMLKVLDLKIISPGSTKEKYKETMENYPGCKQRLKKYGVWAFELTEVDEEREERKFNPRTEIQLSDAKMIKKTAKVDDEIKMKLDVPDAYGRMAAQTAKQVIIQRLREAERTMIYDEFKDKENEVVSGVVQRREGRIVLVDLGKAVGVLPAEEQIYNEKYNPGERIKVYIKGVNMTPRGPEIVLSRTSEEILKKIFYLEIPEISNGLIELKAVAREAGSRSKVGVATDSDNVDPIGSCVGQRGSRIQTIINELGGEKVDIIEYDEDSAKFIANALSPAKILNIEIDEKARKALVTVSDDQLSLAIGKGGQNARLAARLTGWKIDIVEARTEENEENKGKVKEKKQSEGDKAKTADPSASSHSSLSLRAHPSESKTGQARQQTRPIALRSKAGVATEEKDGDDKKGLDKKEAEEKIKDKKDEESEKDKEKEDKTGKKEDKEDVDKAKKDKEKEKSKTTDNKKKTTGGKGKENKGVEKKEKKEKK